jgi:rubrerythrin
MAGKKTVVIILAAVAGFGVLMFAACAGLVFYGYQSADETVSPHVDALFAAIENGTFADTYETHTTSELQAVVTREQYAAIGDAISTRLGRLQSKSLQSFKMNQTNARSMIVVTYNAEFEKGSGTIMARLRKVGDEWKFVEFRVNSPELLENLVMIACPSCGEIHPESDRFCPSCGTELRHASTADIEQSEASEMVEGSEQLEDGGRQSPPAAEAVVPE